MNTTGETSSIKQPYRIACYGYANKNAGSLVGAGFLILRELLERGYEIDFYGWQGFNDPEGLFEYKNFRFITIPNRSLLRPLLEKLPNFLKKTISPILNQLFIIPSDYEAMRQEILTNHQQQRYELLFFHGLPSPFTFGGVPIISWLQGSTVAEWFFIQKLRHTIISLCGITLYIKLMAYYAFKMRRIVRNRKNSDVLICGSQWSKKQLVSEGVEPESIKVLPYPMDLDLFKPNTSPIQRKLGDRKVFLWLGRCDPRKRLDLLLQAYALVLKERQDVYLKIFGSFRYAQGYKKLVDQFEFPDHLEYKLKVERSKVPEIIAESDILVQPSEGEDFGSSVAEALCYGLPVIVGPTNGTKDYISSSSFVFGDYTPASLKETMLQAIQAVEQDREKLALEARRAAEQNFDVSKIVDNLQDIFQEALELY